MTEPLWALDATVLAVGIRAGAYTCEEVVASAIGRTRELNPGLNAVVSDLGDEAIVAARMADRVPVGDRRGELYGVPITIKVNIDVEGQPTTNGLRRTRPNRSRCHSARRPTPHDRVIR